MKILKDAKFEIEQIVHKITLPFEELKENEKETMLLYIQGQQSFGSTIYQLCGHTIGKMIDTLGMILGGAIIERLGEKTGLDKKAQKFFINLFGKENTKRAFMALSMGKNGWGKFSEAYPETARNMEASIGPAEFALLLSGVKIDQKKLLLTQKGITRSIELSTIAVLKDETEEVLKEIKK